MRMSSQWTGMPSVCHSVLPCPFLVHVQPFFTTNNYWKLLTHCITQVGFSDLHNPSNPPPEPEKTRTCESRLGFHWVRVGVTLKPPQGDPCQSLDVGKRHCCGETQECMRDAPKSTNLRDKRSVVERAHPVALESAISDHMMAPKLPKPDDATQATQSQPFAFPMRCSSSSPQSSCFPHLPPSLSANRTQATFSQDAPLATHQASSAEETRITQIRPAVTDCPAYFISPSYFALVLLNSSFLFRLLALLRSVPVRDSGPLCPSLTKLPMD